MCTYTFNDRRVVARGLLQIGCGLVQLPVLKKNFYASRKMFTDAKDAVTVYSDKTNRGRITTSIKSL